TLSVDQVMFRQAINVGELVTFLASVNHTGTSSMEIGIKVVAEDIRKQSVRHANSCFFTMVAVDDDGRTTPVPPLEPSTPDEIRRFAAARLRRQLREEMERRHAELGSRAVENP
ncbi:MAG TPA: hotdog domain-containing protein, partial [Pseudoxanthomonas sp.]